MTRRSTNRSSRILTEQRKNDQNIHHMCREDQREIFRDAIDEYSKRLSRYTKLNIIEVADEMTPDGASTVLEDQIREKEGARILAKLPQDALIVTLEIAGKNYSSEEFAAWIEDCSVRGKATSALSSVAPWDCTIASAKGRIWHSAFPK